MPEEAPRGYFARLGRRTWAGLGVGLALAVADVVCLATLEPGIGRLVLFASLVVAFAALGAAVLAWWGFRRSTLLVLLGAFAAYTLYLLCTGFDQRNYDALDHLKYIHRIADQHELPVAADCGICHHPPMYHLLGAAVMVAARRAEVVSAPFALQTLSIGLLLVFVAFGTRTVELLTSNPRVQPWAAAFLAFWPTSIMASVRLNNDLLLYAWTAAAMYWLVRWRREGSRRALMIACALVAAATLTKLNGLILGAAVVGLWARDLVRKGESRALGKRAAPVVAAMAAVVVLFAGVRLARESGSIPQRAMGAAAAGDVMPRVLTDYLWLDPVRYGKEAFSIAGLPGPYWNHLLKSSLFGTRSPVLWSEGAMFVADVSLALAVGWLLLALIAYLVVAALVIRRFPRDHRALSLYLAACFLLAAVAFHVAVPKPHHTDFRFIHPLLIPAAAIFLEAVHAVRRRRRILGFLGYGLLVAFLGMSAGFYASGLRPDARRIERRTLPGPDAEKAGTNPLRMLKESPFFRPRKPSN